MPSNFRSTYDSLIQFNIPGPPPEAPSTPAPPSDDAARRKLNAIKVAGDAVYSAQGQIKARCAQFTYHIAYYYKLAQQGIPSTGTYVGAHGNANQKVYRDNIVKLGYKMIYKGILTKKELVKELNSINTVGTIVCYKSTTNKGFSENQMIAYDYGHTCIYTGGVLGLSKGSNWAASFGNNYGGPFVYGGIPSDSWEYYIFNEI